MISAVVFGTLVVALVQGTLGGLMFWWLGLPAPLLWAAVMALVAVLPFFGAAHRLGARGGVPAHRRALGEGADPRPSGARS